MPRFEFADLEDAFRDSPAIVFPTRAILGGVDIYHDPKTPDMPWAEIYNVKRVYHYDSGFEIAETAEGIFATVYDRVDYCGESLAEVEIWLCCQIALYGRLTIEL